MEGISVIIPVYNAERYLHECINSILKQGNIVKEIICVDDGSTDNSLNILKEYQKKNKQIRIIKNKHCGVSRARNDGLRNVHSEYVMFVDADDYLLNRRLLGLYLYARKRDADILVFGGRTQDKYHTPNWVRKALSPTNKVYKNERKDIFKERGVLPFTFNKLYKLSLLKEIWFPEEIYIAEDNVFQFFAFMQAAKIIFVSKRMYVYRIHTNSVMAKAEEIEKEEQHRCAISYVADRVKENFMYKDAFTIWSDTFKNKHDSRQHKGVFRKFGSYAGEYGLRAAVEHGIGKYILRK